MQRVAFKSKIVNLIVIKIEKACFTAGFLIACVKKSFSYEVDFALSFDLVLVSDFLDSEEDAVLFFSLLLLFPDFPLRLSVT